jgi:hypothetical protein
MTISLVQVMNKLVKPLQVLGRSRHGSRRNVGICIRHCSWEQPVTDAALTVSPPQLSCCRSHGRMEIARHLAMYQRFSTRTNVFSSSTYRKNRQ